MMTMLERGALPMRLIQRSISYMTMVVAVRRANHPLSTLLSILVIVRNQSMSTFRPKESIQIEDSSHEILREHMTLPNLSDLSGTLASRKPLLPKCLLELLGPSAGFALV